MLDDTFSLTGYVRKPFEEFLQRKKLAEKKPMIFLEMQKSMLGELGRLIGRSSEERKEVYRRTNLAILGYESNEPRQGLGTNLDPLTDRRWLDEATRVVRNLDLNLMKQRFSLVNDFLELALNKAASPFCTELWHRSFCLFLSTDTVDRLESIFPVYDYLDFPEQYSLLLIEDTWLDMSSVAPLRYSKYKADIEPRLPQLQYMMPAEKLEDITLRLKNTKAKYEGILGLVRFFEYLIERGAFLVIQDNRI